MNESATLGAYLKRERERRGLALRTISESTKVSVALLEGLEADDISRWPGGIFRRAFVRSYAQCVGLDPDDVVKRFEQQHPNPEVEAFGAALRPGSASSVFPATPTQPGSSGFAPARARLLGTAADLAVATVLAFGSAAAGSRLLWPVLLIASYYAIGILLTGTSPMVALLGEQPDTSGAGASRALSGDEHLKAQPSHLPSAAAASSEPAAPLAVIQARPQPRRARQRRDAAARA